MKKTKILLYFLSAVIVAAIIFSLFYSRVNFFGGLKINIPPDGIKQIAAITARDLNLKTNNTISKAELSPDEGLIAFTQDKIRSDKSKNVLWDSLPVYRWKVSWSVTGVNGINFSSGNQKNKNREEYLKALRLELDLQGRILTFFRPLEDSINLPKLTRDEAKSLAENFISRYSSIKNLSLNDSSYQKGAYGEHSLSYSMNSSGDYSFKNEKKIERLNRTDYEFSWAGEANSDSIKKIINVSVSGNMVTSFSQEFKVNEKYYQESDNGSYRILLKGLFYIVIFIMLAIIAYKRVRAYEIGFRLAFILGAVVALCVGVEIYLDINAQFTLELLIPLIFGPLFISAGVILVWAASETITREVWKEKFISIDLATKGYVLHSRVGSAIIKGLTYGFLISSGILILYFIMQNLLGMLVVNNGDIYKHFSSFSPALSILFHSIYTSIFLIGVFFIFIVSGLRRRFHNDYILLLICGVLWGIVNIGAITPFYFGILAETITGLAFVYLFIKTDVLVTLFSLVTSTTLSIAFSLLTLNNSFYAQSAYFLIAVLIFTVLVATISLYTKDKISEFDTITPAFAKNITERQRLQRELEIARDVQMSFLPKTIPSFRGLEVASQCIPALEVGGDYYDFVTLSDSLFGIIIGDVSGKGTQAAFYMTLTKGFLKAISRTSESPSVVLSKMNELFYENVERGTFISMIYGIFDNEKKTFKLARAGHNPVIVKNSPGKIEMLNPTGLALGLEKGTVFSRTIKELEVPYAPGDVFIFYTDGFTEAMNKQKDEYGEERLTSLVEKISHLSAEEILDNIIKEVKIFMGKANQHDDMTMVVVKVSN